MLLLSLLLLLLLRLLLLLLWLLLLLLWLLLLPLVCSPAAAPATVKAAAGFTRATLTPGPGRTLTVFHSPKTAQLPTAIPQTWTTRPSRCSWWRAAWRADVPPP